MSVTIERQGGGEACDIRICERGVTLTHRYHETVGYYFPPMMSRDSHNTFHARTASRLCVVCRPGRRRDAVRPHTADTTDRIHVRATSGTAATCARTPRWLISSQISLLDCGAARWSMPAASTPRPRPHPIRTPSVSAGPTPWSYTGNPEHYCYTVVHCQQRKMETRARDIINDRRSLTPKLEPVWPSLVPSGSISDSSFSLLLFLSLLPSFLSFSVLPFLFWPL